jgi:hypothetical protein
MPGLLSVLVAAAVAPVIAVEAGTVTMLGRSLCAVAGDDRVQLRDGRLVVPDTAAFAQLAVSVGDCTAPSKLAVAVVPPLADGLTAARIYPAEARLELLDRQLSRAVVRWARSSRAWRWRPSWCRAASCVRR